MTDSPRNGWVRLILPWAISSLAGGLLAFGALRGEVESVRRVQEAQQQAIVERLKEIQQDIRELRSEVRGRR